MKLYLAPIVVSIATSFFRRAKVNLHFNRAQELMDSRCFSEAQEIFSTLFDDHTEAVAKFAECLLLQSAYADASVALDLLQQALSARCYLNSTSDVEMYEIVEERANFRLTKLRFDQIIKNNDPSRIKSLEENISYIDSIRKKELINDFEKLKQKNQLSLAHQYFKLGLYEEKRNSLPQASKLYGKAMETLRTQVSDKSFQSAHIRLKICKLKCSINLPGGFLSGIEPTNPYAEELYYRYAIRLIKDGQITRAEKIVKKYLNGRKANLVKLRKVIDQEKKKKAVFKVNAVNEQIELLHAGIFDQKTINFYNELPTIIADLITIFPGLSGQLEEFKPLFFNRLLSYYYESNQYDRAVDLILDYPAFYNSPTLMKNLGNACLNFISNHDLTEDNYRITISSFLSATFADEVMLDSLADTVWDDGYTFTLIDSIGAVNELELDLPGNVNCEPKSETNISIGEAQRLLLSQFEYLLQNQNIDIPLKNAVISYYNFEKSVLELVSASIPVDGILTGPYLAKKYNLYPKILRKLEKNEWKLDEEQILEAGSFYNFDRSSDFFNDYDDAKETIQTIIEAIANQDLDALEEMTTEENIELIQSYPRLLADLEDSIIKAFHILIGEDSGNEDLLPLMEQASTAVPESTKFNYLYSNYICELCTNFEWDDFDGLDMIWRAYQKNPDNINVCRILVHYLNNNVIDILNEEASEVEEIFRIVGWINSHKSATFRQNCELLKETQNKIWNSQPKPVQNAINASFEYGDEILEDDLLILKVVMQTLVMLCT